jgi:diguanylate cyclase (GGDEF)-like protein
MDALGDVAFRLDASGLIRAASGRTRQLLSAHPRLDGADLVTLVHETEQAPLRNAVRVADGASEPQVVEARLRCGEREVWIELRIAQLPGSTDLLAVGRDMSTQRATEQRLRHMATHDALTELPNRLLLSDRIRMVIANARRSGQGFSVATVGLDGFKKVNDGLGHPVGDAVLRLAAIRLRKTLRDSDTLARVGGDEFVAILPGTFLPDQLKLVTGRLLAAMQSPFEVDKHTVYLGASVGVAVYPDHAEDEVRLLAMADAAMSRAKETGKGRAEVYAVRENEVPQHDISLEAAMFQAVREGEFMLFYQPIVSASTRQIEGFETLMRWKHPTLGLVPPVRFIPIAENNGLINLLGAWALKSALVQVRQFEEVAKRELYISVNISPRQFRNDRFLQVLDDALAFSGAHGSKLVLEITEGTLMVDPVQAEAILTRMAERKARIAIDDFGTGYSSLAYLKRFPISVLKIDRAFIKELPGNAKDAAICNAVLDLAKHLNMAVVAEGIETEEQLSYVESRGCDYVQGYLTGKPMPAHAAITALTENLYTALMPDELRARQI